MNTILIIDDHAGFRVQARAILEADGFIVVGEADDGASGLAAAARYAPISSSSISACPTSKASTSPGSSRSTVRHPSSS